MPYVWPREFYELPDGNGIVKADARPCGACGSDEFQVVQTALGQRAQCKCVKLKRGDKVIGQLDRKRWILHKEGK